MKINLHSHTTFCDGKNSAEEMVVSAIDHGFDVFGFSGHSYTPFDESYCMSLSGTVEYRKEIERLASHIAQARKIMAQGGECGKKLDFLIQEFNRETNTICSKSNDLSLTEYGLKLKNEIEKLREQVQNIE